MSVTQSTPKKQTELRGNGDGESISNDELRAIAAEYSESGRVLDRRLLPWASDTSKQRLRHIECPICGHSLLPGEGVDPDQWEQLRTHLSRPDHQPEGVGLAPLREQSKLGDGV